MQMHLEAKTRALKFTKKGKFLLFFSFSSSKSIESLKTNYLCHLSLAQTETQRCRKVPHCEV